MKKLLALLMVMALMLTALVGCGGGNDNKDSDEPAVEIGEEKELTAEKLVGDWDMVIDFDKMLSVAGGIPGLSDLGEETGMDMEGMLEAFKEINFRDMRLGVTFTEDGELTFDMEDMVDALLGILDDYVEWLGKGDNLYSFLATATGMTPEQAKKELEATGMNAETYLSMLSAQFDSMKETMKDSMDEVMAEMEKTSYELDGNKIYIESESSDGYYEFKYDGRKIHVIAIEADGEKTELEEGVLYFE